MHDSYQDLEKLSNRSFHVARAGLITTFAAATILVTGVYGEDAWKRVTGEKDAAQVVEVTKQSPVKDFIFKLSLAFGLVGMTAGFGGTMMNAMANIDLDQMERLYERERKRFPAPPEV